MRACCSNPDCQAVKSVQWRAVGPHVHLCNACGLFAARNSNRLPGRNQRSRGAHRRPKAAAAAQPALPAAQGRVAAVGAASSPPAAAAAAGAPAALQQCAAELRSAARPSDSAAAAAAALRGGGISGTDALRSPAQAAAVAAAGAAASPGAAQALGGWLQTLGLHPGGKPPPPQRPAASPIKVAPAGVPLPAVASGGSCCPAAAPPSSCQPGTDSAGAGAGAQLGAGSSGGSSSSSGYVLQLEQEIARLRREVELLLPLQQDNARLRAMLREVQVAPAAAVQAAAAAVQAADGGGHVEQRAAHGVPAVLPHRMHLAAAMQPRIRPPSAGQASPPAAALGRLPATIAALQASQQAQQQAQQQAKPQAQQQQVQQLVQAQQQVPREEEGRPQLRQQQAHQRPAQLAQQQQAQQQPAQLAQQQQAQQQQQEAQQWHQRQQVQGKRQEPLAAAPAAAAEQAPGGNQRHKRKRQEQPNWQERQEQQQEEEESDPDTPAPSLSRPTQPAIAEPRAAAAAMGVGGSCRLASMHCVAALAAKQKDGTRADVQRFHLIAPQLAKRTSAIHGSGMFAVEPIRQHAFVAQYTGVAVDEDEADVREERYRASGVDMYFFRIQPGLVIDATYKGSDARFINHSCAPNCVSKVLLDTRTGQRCIVIFAKVPIEQGQELTYDYMVSRDPSEPSMPCNCGSPACKRRIDR